MPTIVVNDSRVNLRDVGSGPPVVLLHSASSHSGQWKPLSEEISDRFRVLAPDLHGYGRSDKLPQDEHPYQYHDGAILRAVVDECAQPVHLVGHSLGGTIALRFAIEHPDSVTSLTLIEPVLFSLLEEVGDPTAVDYLELAHAMMVLVRFGDRERAARIFLDFWVGPRGLDEMDPHTRDYVIRTIDRVVDDWFGISMHSPAVPKLADLAQIAAPTLVMCAKRTQRSARAIAHMLRASIPNAEYAEIPEGGHLSPMTHPAHVNGTIAAFIDKHTGVC